MEYGIGIYGIIYCTNVYYRTPNSVADTGIIASFSKIVQCIMGEATVIAIMNGIGSGCTVLKCVNNSFVVKEYLACAVSSKHSSTHSTKALHMKRHAMSVSALRESSHKLMKTSDMLFGARSGIS